MGRRGRRPSRTGSGCLVSGTLVGQVEVLGARAEDLDGQNRCADHVSVGDLLGSGDQEVRLDDCVLGQLDIQRRREDFQTAGA